MPGPLIAAVLGILASGVVHAMGDARRGEELYVRCAACHSLAQDRVGPRHCGLLGRRAGIVPGFDYSAAMRKSGIVWNAESLDRFLANPMKVVPGTTMTYAGVDEKKDRADLIAFLAKAATTAECKKP